VKIVVLCNFLQPFNWESLMFWSRD